MNKKTRNRSCMAGGLLSAFCLWTAIVLVVDVQPIGPLKSCVGLAALNGLVHRLTGIHMGLYVLTDWLSIVPVGFVLGFACLGGVQWIKRKRLLAVDRSILILGGFYLAVLTVYLIFEVFVVNYRPVLIEGILEASYPSSTTMLVLCVMLTAMMQMKARIHHAVFRRYVLLVMSAYTTGMIALRLVSGVHWLSDIIGGALLSAGLVIFYSAACEAE